MPKTKNNPIKVTVALGGLLLLLLANGGAWGGPVQEGEATFRWVPNGPRGGSRYVGDETCAGCHASISRTQRQTAMARALETAAESENLRAHPHLTFRSGHFTYTVTREGTESIYAVSDGTRTIREPVRYVAGRGKAGQTLLIEHEGAFYDTRVSFYNDVRALDVTFEFLHTTPRTMDEALGERKTASDALRCFRCHATTAPGEMEFSLQKFTPGVRCEACHGPGEKHVAAMKAGAVGKEKYIFNPATLSGEQLTQGFCGSCHRSADDVLGMAGQGSLTHFRFQPFQLYKSACYSDDKRISCTACHDPHKNLETAPVSYDAKCLACHELATGPVSANQSKRAAPHPPGTQKCVTCHMPKVELPGGHIRITDHQIQVPGTGR